MICQTCKELGLKSKVRQGVSSTTLAYFAPYWDEEGVYHDIYGNTTTRIYNCSNGHSWTESTNSKCDKE